MPNNQGNRVISVIDALKLDINLMSAQKEIIELNLLKLKKLIMKKILLVLRIKCRN